MNKDSFSSTLLPILRKAMPGMLANSIVGVQPMSGNTGQIFTMKGGFFSKPFTIVDSDIPGWVVLTVSNEVYNWLKEFPADQWKNVGDEHTNPWVNNVTITEELFTMLALKWGGE